MNRRLSLYAIFFLISCNNIPNKVELALKRTGEKRPEFEKVIKHFRESGEKEKLKAAYFLLEHLPGQFHYTGSGVIESQKAFKKMDSIISLGNCLNYKLVWDSLEKTIKNINQLEKERDIDLINSDFLIKNIDLAFRTKSYAWAREMPTDIFLKYVLPYKLKNEHPSDFRSYFLKKYYKIADSLKDEKSPLKLINKINEDLGNWFYLTKLKVPFDLSFNDLIKIKSGRCPQEVQLAAYAMRALGIPVAMDGVPLWGNRDFRHDWNAWISENKAIPFLGTEVNPGSYKLAFKWPASVSSKIAKAFRSTYETQISSLMSINADNEEDVPRIFESSRFEDVTHEYVPVSNIIVRIPDNALEKRYAYLCVFNNQQWKPVHWGKISSNNEILFSNMGRGIVYLPVFYENLSIVPAGVPIRLQSNGEISEIIPNLKTRHTVKLYKKYPAGKDNEIIPGFKYELFFWNNEWHSLGKKKATSKVMVYDNVPKNSLLWLRSLDDGFQERIFTIEKKQIWW